MPDIANLTDMEIDEISLVDKGANPSAHVTFFKRNQKGEDMTLEELAKRLESVEAENAILKAKAGMTDAEKAYMDKMEDEEQRKRFMSASADERKKIMSGKDMKKSQEGEGLEKRLTDLEEVNKSLLEVVNKVRDENELLKLEKRAEAELPGIAGTPEQKAKLLKALESIEDEGVREMALGNLAKKSKANMEMTKSSGESQTSEGASPADELDAMAKAVKAEDTSLTYAQAYTKALDSAKGQEIRKRMRKGE